MVFERLSIILTSDSGVYILHESFLKAGGTIRQKVVSEEAIGIVEKYIKKGKILRNPFYPHEETCFLKRKSSSL